MKLTVDSFLTNAWGRGGMTTAFTIDIQSLVEDVQIYIMRNMIFAFLSMYAN